MSGEFNKYTSKKVKDNFLVAPDGTKRERKIVPTTTQVSPDDLVRYEFDYYASGNVQIFFGDIWLDDINFIEFQAEHPKIPVYGYASKLYNTTTPGRILVSGSFRINFKESFYLHLLFEHLQKNNMIPGMQGRLSAQQKAYAQAGQQGEWVKGAIADDVLWHNTIEATMSAFNNKTDPRNQTYTGEQGLTATMGALNPAQFRNDEKAFEAAAEALEDQIWGPPAGTSDLKRVDSYGPFDVYIVYGDLNNQFANHTVRRLYGVELASTTQQIEVSGQPVQESYSFISRDFR